MRLSGKRLKQQIDRGRSRLWKVFYVLETLCVCLTPPVVLCQCLTPPMVVALIHGVNV